MNNYFAAYGAVLLMIYAWSIHEGYAFSSMFNNTHHASAAENHLYHK